MVNFLKHGRQSNNSHLREDAENKKESLSEKRERSCAFREITNTVCAQRGMVQAFVKETEGGGGRAGEREADDRNHGKVELE